MEDGGGTGPHTQRRWDMDWVLLQIGALASDQTRSEGQTGEDQRIQPESGAKTVAAQPRLGYAVRAEMPKWKSWRTDLRAVSL